MHIKKGEEKITRWRYYIKSSSSSSDSSATTQIFFAWKHVMLMSSSVTRVTYFSTSVSTCNMSNIFTKYRNSKFSFSISYSPISVCEIIIILSMQKLFFTIVFYIINIWIAIKNNIPIHATKMFRLNWNAEIYQNY